jgi:hypothetical protein
VIAALRIGPGRTELVYALRDLARSICPSQISLNGTIGIYAGKEIDRFQKRCVVEAEFDQAEADA